MTQDWALVGRELQAWAAGREILRGVQVQIPAGQWTCIVGPNGAGKTTLLRALAGLPADALVRGEVWLQGRPLKDWPARERARQLAWLGQNEAVSPQLRCAEIVMLGRLPHQRWLAAPSAEDHAVVERCLQQAGAWAWRDRPLQSLSGGERQRVLLARALAVQAPVLLMDEPLVNLDPPHQADWMEQVQALVAQGQTVVSVLHELSLALQADHLIVMAQGRIVHQGPAGAAPTHAALEAVFEDRIRVTCVDGQWVTLPVRRRAGPGATES